VIRIQEEPNDWCTTVQAQCQALQVEGRRQDSKLHAIDLAELRMANTGLVRGIEDKARQVAQQKLAAGRSAQVTQFCKSPPPPGGQSFRVWQLRAALTGNFPRVLVSVYH